MPTGAFDGFEETFPDCENVFTADTLSQGELTAEAAYNEVAPILAAHPEIETWFIVGVLDDWAQGATRAIEAAGFEDRTLITSVGGEVLTQEWETGYEGCWMACAYFTGFDFADELWPNMLSVAKGEAAMEDLWPEWKNEGEDFAVCKIPSVAIDRETYLNEYAG